jgi:putative flippase GtrA
MITFLKAQGSSLAATLADFLVTILLTEVLGVWYAVANVAGVVTGGVVNFTVNRHWVFESTDAAVRQQAVRYILVWCGNLLLNALGVYFITKEAHWNYILSKVLVALVIGWGYNYVLQKKYVFKQPESCYVEEP